MKTIKFGFPHKTLMLSFLGALAINALMDIQTLAQGGPAVAPCKGCTGHDGKDPNLLQGEYTPSPDPVGGAPRYRANTESTTLQTGTDSTMLQTGTDSTMLQTGTDSTTLQTGAQNTTIQAGVTRLVEPTNILILIDCSQSMKEGIGSPLSGGREEKMNAAKTVLEQTMSQIPSEFKVGLRVFGQSFHNDPYIDCQQSALLVPIGTHNRRTIIERIRQIRPFGLTPLTYALREAANDLAQVQGRKHLILISDGAETCGFDPCMEVRRITASGINVKIDIVGIGLKRDWEAKQQLNCISSQTGGKFYDANTAAEMIESLRNTLKQAVGESKVSGKVITRFAPPKDGATPAKDTLPSDIKNSLPADLR